MAANNLIAFLAKIDHDATLQERIDSLPTDSPEVYRAQFLALSEEYASPLTPEDFQSLQRLSAGELSESELSAVAGGGVIDIIDGFTAKMLRRMAATMDYCRLK